MVMSEDGRRRLSLYMKTNNPMKRPDVKLKSSISHMGHPCWNKGMDKEEYLKHYPNGFRGGRPFGYKHTIESRIKMSLNGTGISRKRKFTDEERARYAERMRLNRKNKTFNEKMFISFQRQVTKPHKKIIRLLKKKNIVTETNYTIQIGCKYGSIDEADVNNKIAIFVDGNYWHNYPNLRKWDKTVNTCLENKGWRVLRFWESDIKNDINMIENKIANVYGGNQTQHG